jgi:hypothetical protein
LSRAVVLVVALAVAGGTPAPALELPVGTPLSIRLTTRVSSHKSRRGDAVRAVLIAPVEIGGLTALPAGEVVSGTVREVEKRHGRASLRLDFSALVGEDGVTRPIAARVTAIEDSRESVAEDGRIVGIPSMRRLPSPLVVFLMAVAPIHPVLVAAFGAGRLALRAVKHSAIDYAPGVELSLVLEAPLEVEEPEPTPPPVQADPALHAVVQALPFRTQSAKRNRDVDVTNVLIVGSRPQVESAFADAGWTRARSMSMRARLRGLWALVTRRGYKSAAVSRHELSGRPPELVFQKQNNTLTKRHHVRIWSCPGDSGGPADVWVGAATHDVAIVFDRRERAFTHRIDPRIDGEREKIVNDLQATGRVGTVSLVDRPDAPRLDGGAPDTTIETDGRVAVVVLLPAPVVVPTDVENDGPAESSPPSPGP